ncbi:MAG: hypothetical protein JRJ19_16050 [Deltaproteobacteria bacterium]|nr:hypothetical protein [Deltaproteobacteria bacterium]MBW1873580.1 hypothetical protein [Deltaproteobacteria bacterium]
MKLGYVCLFLVLVTLMLTGPQVVRADDFTLESVDAEQVVLVLTDSWDSLSGQAYLFNRADKEYIQVGETLPIVVGRKGLGWGIGLHSNAGLAGPQKREGDGKGVAGVFRFDKVMGYAAKPPSGTSLTYVQSKTGTRCVDDSKSTQYNRIVELKNFKGKAKDWKSSERMVRKDKLYKLLIAIDHNTSEKPNTLGGSCIFFHIWRANNKGTAGCTATTEKNLVRLIEFIKAKDKSVLVQMPRAVYHKLQKPWGLPPVGK